VRKRAREIMERNSATDISVVGEEAVPKDKSQPVARH
jgi:hypothetical protein